MDYQKLTDKQIVEGILSQDQDIIEFFFFSKCAPLFGYIISTVFDGKIERDELINELYIYLSGNNWNKLRQFDYRSKLITWVSVVSIRFFIKKRRNLIDNDSTEALMYRNQNEYVSLLSIESKIDITTALNKMPNKRYAMVIEKLELLEQDVQQVATEMGISVENLYNIRRRARAQFSEIIKDKRDNI